MSYRRSRKAWFDPPIALAFWPEAMPPGLSFFLENHAMSDLREIPWVGEKIEALLNNVGVYSIEDMRKNDPEKLYDDLCDIKASPVDRCVLYVFRCAKYFVSSKNHDPERLKWWSWKD